MDKQKSRERILEYRTGTDDRRYSRLPQDDTND